jgi:hypothetical protein
MDGFSDLPRDLVELVDVDDPVLRVHDIEVRGLEEPDEDVLHVLAHVARLGEAGRVDDGERHLEDARERPREERLPRAGRADQEDVRLLELDVVDGAARVDALVVVVDGDGERLLGALLADHVVVQDLLDLGRLRERALGRADRVVGLTLEDVVAELDALAANVDGRSRHETRDLVLAAAAEAAPDGMWRADALLHEFLGVLSRS